MMNTATATKIENLRALIPADGLTMDAIMRLTYRAENLPSVTTLRKYNLLKVVRIESIVSTMTEEEMEDTCAEEPDFGWNSSWIWDEVANLWVSKEEIKFFGI